MTFLGQIVEYWVNENISQKGLAKWNTSICAKCTPRKVSQNTRTRGIHPKPISSE
jgi:hypothetical protein